MKINDTALNGSTSYLATTKHLQTVAGKNISWFSEFTPTCFPFRETLYLLMSAFLRGGNCFFLSGTFVSHVAGILDGYRGACLYITVTDIYLVRLLFQSRLTHFPLFWFHVSTTTFNNRGRPFRLQNQGHIFHEGLCFLY